MCVEVKMLSICACACVQSLTNTYCPSACVLLVDVSVGVNKKLSETTVTMLTGIEERGHVVPGCGVCECEGVSLNTNVPSPLHRCSLYL